MQGEGLSDAFRDGVVLLDWGPSQEHDDENSDEESAAAPVDEATRALRWLDKLQHPSRGLCMQLALDFSVDPARVCVLQHTSACTALAPTLTAESCHTQAPSAWFTTLIKDAP